jgi:hypothetical protein
MIRQFVRAGKRGMSTSTAKKVVVVDGSRTPFALASTYVVLGSLDDVVVLGKLSSLVHTNTSYDQPHTHTDTTRIIWHTI